MIPNPMMYLKTGALVIFLSACLASYLLYNQNVKLKVDISEKDAALVEANRSIETLSKIRVDDQVKVLEYSKKLNKIERDYRDAVQSLEKQKQKKKVIISNTSVVTNRVNTATKRMFNDVSCITGDMQRCATDTSTITPTSDTDKP